ncbi:hypothetical protein N7474_005460 [Penicillium riverlandense]|uniref:uncharacterized protein n=1 Tax=Penicillium riverlandense TaxID=1903569 RepID=UPI00254900AE|nr:uncharacterized protein N7474_005460 [Penicillium riverlandense]KAJ5819869.1 hypothetical protein N7474_005460 [Penicillium riverlandense]
MADELSHFVREVERLVTAPYVPSLQELHEAVQNSSPAVLDLWASYKPCQVGLLADVLVDSLSRSRVALPLVAVFVSSPVFRDAFLARHPVVLDTFLEKAAGESGSEYTSACIALLSSPLPQNMVLPARVGTFISDLISTIADNPCAETITPLYKIMSGLQGSSKVLDDVSSDTMSSLQTEFTKTLRNLDDHMGNLLCLATFARIASAGQTNQHSQHGPEPPSWLLNIKHFFGPKRGLKTLDLVVLRVILASSASCNNLTPAKAAESVKLAICIADVVEPEQKSAWISGNRSKIAKLCDKLVRAGIDREIQIMGATFLLSLLPLSELPQQIHGIALRTLMSTESSQVLKIMPAHLVRRLTRTLAESGEPAVRELVNSILSALKHTGSPAQEALSSLKVAGLILCGLQEVQSQPALSAIQTLIFAFGKDSIGKLFESFPAQSIQTDCSGTDTCFSVLNISHDRLVLNLFDFYSAAALARHDGNKTMIKTMKSFVDRVAGSLPGSTCGFSAASSNDFRVSFAVQDRHDFSTGHGLNRNWRCGITEVFMQNAQTSHDCMIKKVEDICRDLEQRCYNVEGPLRAVEEERDSATHEANRLKQHNEELEVRLHESSNTVSALRHELSCLEEHAENASARAEELSASLDAARHDLEEQRQAFEERMRAEMDKVRSRELDLIATSTEKDDQIDEIREELGSLQAKEQQMLQTLDTLSKEKDFAMEASASIRQDLANAQALVESSRLLSVQKEDEVKRLLTDKEDMQMEMGALKSTVDEQSVDIERLYCAMQEAEEKLGSEIDMLKQSHKAEISQTVSEITRHKEENQRLQAAVADSAKEAQSQNKRIQYLEKKIQSLRNERAAKAREFSEAQQHISRLMGVMGFATKSTEHKGHSKQKHVNPVPDNTDTTPTQQAISYDDEDTQLAQSFESLASNLGAPSPKRPKSNRRSIHPPDCHAPPPAHQPTPKEPKSKNPEASGPHQARRKPLMEADRNSPTKSLAGYAPKHSRQDQEDVPTVYEEAQVEEDNSDEHQLRNLSLGMDLEFSRDFVFTSTAFSGSNNEPLAP